LNPTDGSGGDVAADKVRVVRLQVLRRTHVDGGDAITEPGGVGLYAIKDRLSQVTRVAGWNVGVAVDGVQVADRASRIGQILLADQDEGGRGHFAVDNEPLGCGYLGEGAAHVHCAGSPGRVVGPRDAPLDCEGELECTGPLTIPTEGSGDSRGEALARDVRGSGWRGVEHDEICIG